MNFTGKLSPRCDIAIDNDIFNDIQHPATSPAHNSVMFGPMQLRSHVSIKSY